MKTYAVCVDQGAGLVVLKAYESEAVNYGAFTLQQIAGNHCGMYFTSTRKKECLDFINKNCPTSQGWQFKDVADWVYDQYAFGRNCKQYCLI